ncbi:MAG: serine/threonine protein kinase [Planctomycetes bacterium]|nr:serine/threonine protein kinase [Planctomycetota bacterium]
MSPVDDFLRNVLRSGLLDREQLQKSLRTLPRDRREDVNAIKEHLIQQKALTRFQVFKISQGITLGLTLGPYRLLVPLGRGGMGTVYLAIDSRSGQYIALKILPPKVARQEERLLARFRREMELSQKIQHPHLARTIEAGAFLNIHHIAMEFIPGQTLYRVVMDEGPLPIGRAAHLFAEVAAALGQAHAQGVIHRDMKPSNIMVTPHDHAKVLDLGLAYTEGEVVEDIDVVGGKGYIVGSIDYMAPEQTRDSTAVDARADLYALGCCLYFALTGKPPFPDGPLMARVRAHRAEVPASLHDRNPDVPETFAAIVHRLLAKNPADRFASAGELVKVLEAWSVAPTQALEAPGDPAVEEEIRKLTDGWMVAETAVKDASEDALLFRIDAEVKSAGPEFLSRSIFDEIDRVQPHVWLLAVVVIWVVVLMCCILGTCVASFAK